MRVKNIVHCDANRFREKALRRWKETKQRLNWLRIQHFTLKKETSKMLFDGTSRH